MFRMFSLQDDKIPLFLLLVSTASTGPLNQSTQAPISKRFIYQGYTQQNDLLWVIIYNFESAKSENFLLLHLDTRVAGCRLGEGGLHLGKAIGVLEEDNVSLVLDELALPENAVNLGPAAGTTIHGDSSRSKFLLQSSTCFPSE